jgi:hypothetical protein
LPCESKVSASILCDKFRNLINISKVKIDLKAKSPQNKSSAGFLESREYSYLVTTKR